MTRVHIPRAPYPGLHSRYSQLVRVDDASGLKSYCQYSFPRCSVVRPSINKDSGSLQLSCAIRSLKLERTLVETKPSIIGYRMLVEEPVDRRSLDVQWKMRRPKGIGLAHPAIVYPLSTMIHDDSTVALVYESHECLPSAWIISEQLRNTVPCCLCPLDARRQKGLFIQTVCQFIYK